MRPLDQLDAAFETCTSNAEARAIYSLYRDVVDGLRASAARAESSGGRLGQDAALSFNAWAACMLQEGAEMIEMTKRMESAQ